MGGCVVLTGVAGECGCTSGNVARWLQPSPAAALACCSTVGVSKLSAVVAILPKPRKNTVLFAGKAMPGLPAGRASGAAAGWRVGRKVRQRLSTWRAAADGDGRWPVAPPAAASFSLPSPLLTCGRRQRHTLVEDWSVQQVQRQVVAPGIRSASDGLGMQRRMYEHIDLLPHPTPHPPTHAKVKPRLLSFYTHS